MPGLRPLLIVSLRRLNASAMSFESNRNAFFSQALKQFSRPTPWPEDAMRFSAKREVEAGGTRITLEAGAVRATGCRSGADSCRSYPIEEVQAARQR